jgi:type IV pilus assembly protein PilC
METHTQHSIRDIAIASRMLGGMIRAGLALDEATRHLNASLPGRGWSEVSERVARGSRLSECLATMWPDALVSAVAAGDESGRLSDVMKQIEKTMELKKEISDTLKQLYTPAAYVIGGVAAAGFYAVTVLPKMAQASKSMLGSSYEAGTGVIFSEWLQDLIFNHWMSLGVSAAAIVISLVWLFRLPEFWAWLFVQADKIPVLNSALRNLYFGLWAQTLAMMSASGGIEIIKMLVMSAKIMPNNMQAGVIKMAGEVERLGLSVAGDPRRQSDDDPRRLWPLYVGIAFVSAGQTGNIEVEMSRISPELIDDGMRTLKVIIKVASTAALVVSGLLVALAPIMMMLEQGNLFKQTMSM